MYVDADIVVAKPVQDFLHFLDGKTAAGEPGCHSRWHRISINDEIEADFGVVRIFPLVSTPLKSPNLLE